MLFDRQIGSKAYFHIPPLAKLLFAVDKATLKPLDAGVRVFVRSEVRFLGKGLITLVTGVGFQPHVAVVVNLYHSPKLENTPGKINPIETVVGEKIATYL